MNIGPVALVKAKEALSISIYCELELQSRVDIGGIEALYRARAGKLYSTLVNEQYTESVTVTQ